MSVSVITGSLADYPVPEDAPEFKGSVVIEWPTTPHPAPANLVLPGALASVYDAETGDLIPVAKLTVHAEVGCLITADLAVFLDRQGELIHDPSVIWRDSNGTPATFTFLVRGMRDSSDHEKPWRR